MVVRLRGWSTRAGRLEYLVAALVMAGLLAVFFNPIVRHGATFSTVDNVQRHSWPWTAYEVQPLGTLAVQADQGTYIHPRQVFLDRSLKEDGQVPLWDPLAFGGHPYFAGDPTNVSYPPRLVLTALFSPSWTHDLIIILHLFVAGLGMFALMKQFAVGLAGALLAAVSWAFSSYTMGWIQLEVFGTVAALLPLVILAIRRWHDRRSWPALLGAGLLLGLLFLGTGKETALVSFLCAVGYAGALALSRLVGAWSTLSGRTKLALVGAPAALVGIALTVAAVNLLPFLALSGQSQRTDAAPYSTLLAVFKVPPSYFLRAFIPPDIPLTVPNLLSQQLFVGTATGVLALVGLFVRRAGTGLARWLLVLIFLFVVGTPLTWIGYHLVPGLKALNGFGRINFLWCFGLAILGGIGLDAVLRSLSGGRARRMGRALPAVVATVCVLASAGQLLVYGRRANPPFQKRDAASLFPETPALAATRALLGGDLPTGRVIAVSRPTSVGELVGMVGLALDLPVAGGYDPVVPESVSVLWQVVQGIPPGDALVQKISTYATYFPAELIRTELLGRAGVSAVIAPPDVGLEPSWDPTGVAARGLRPVYAGGDGTVFAVEDAVPRAVVVTDAVWARDSADALHRFLQPGFDGRRQVILQGDPDAAASAAASGDVPPGEATVRWLEDNPNDILLAVTSPDPGWLVLLDTWDPDWDASVDGRSVDVVRADYGFRAVPVPAGESTVTFTYRPGRVVVGTWISVLSVTAILGLLVAAAVRSRRHMGRRTQATTS